MSKQECPFGDCDYEGTKQQVTMHLMGKHGLKPMSKTESHPTSNTVFDSSLAGEDAEIDRWINRQYKQAMIKQMMQPQNPNNMFGDFVKFYELMERSKKENPIDEVKKYLELARELGGTEDSSSQYLALVPQILQAYTQDQRLKAGVPNRKREEEDGGHRQTSEEFTSQDSAFPPQSEEITIDQIASLLPPSFVKSIHLGSISRIELNEYRPFLASSGLEITDDLLDDLFNYCRSMGKPVKEAPKKEMSVNEPTKKAQKSTKDGQSTQKKA